VNKWLPLGAVPLFLVAACGAAAVTGTIPPPLPVSALCKEIVLLNLPLMDGLIDNANSPNGQPGDSGYPMSPRDEAALAGEAPKLTAYGRQAAGTLRTGLQVMALEFTLAAASPNGTVTNDQATQTDTAYKQVAGGCQQK